VLQKTAPCGAPPRWLGVRMPRSGTNRAKLYRFRYDRRWAPSASHRSKPPSLHKTQGDSVRRSGATLYASILRFDQDVLLITHLWSVPAGDAPVFTLRMRGHDSLAAHVIGSFDRVWERAQVVG
jgi:hypothetical protein